MNTKQPELTIFQNSPSIHVDNNQMRIEEEEAIQDQKRRQVEVIFLKKQILQFNNMFFFSLASIGIRTRIWQY